MSLQSAINVSNINKTFDNGTRALDDVSLSVEEGSVMAVLGPSGCGKSTLLKLIARLMTPDSGQILCQCSGRGDIGYVFQEPTLMPWADVQANAAMPLEVLGLSEAEKTERVAAALELVGLSDFASAFPRALSGGMKMRVSLARALAPRPRILLLDEPFAALDEITRARLNDDLIHIAAKEKLTVLFVTHSIFEAVYLCDTVVVMSPSPGRPVARIKTGAEPGRDQSWRLTPDYARVCGDVSKALQAPDAPINQLKARP